MAQSSKQPKPTVAELNDQLHDLVDWELFGTYLRGIKSSHIESIEKHSGRYKQKFDLYRKWLKVCPNASWSDVVTALEKVEEFTLAEHIKSIHNNEQHGDQKYKEIKLTETEEDEISIISKLDYFSLTFSDLLTRTRKHIEELIITKQQTLRQITSELENALHFSPTITTKLRKCTQAEDIIDILREYSHFLDCSILQTTIQKLVGKSAPLLQDMNKYVERVQAFKLLETIKNLEHKLKESEIGKNHIPVTIKLNCKWEIMYTQLLQNFIKILMQIEGDIQLIKVVSGSIMIVVTIPKEEEETISNTCSQKKDFMKQMGIFYLQIGTNTILDTEEDNRYTFELGLSEACANGNIETVQFLLHYQFIQHISVDIDHTNSQDGLTPLMIASQNGHGNIVKLLLSSKANVNKQDNNGCTAVMLAKTIEIYQTLVQANADTTIIDNIYYELLLKHNADPNVIDNNGYTLLMYASNGGHNKIVELLLQNGVDPNIINPKDGATALILSSMNGHYDTTELLLMKRADPNVQDNNGGTAIHHSCYKGHYTVTELLLKHNADPNVIANNGYTPLMYASDRGHNKIVQLLLPRVTDVIGIINKRRPTALMAASNNGRYETVKILLQAGHDPNIQNTIGKTAIHYTSTKGHYRVTELLLDSKAEPNLADNKWCTPLMLASQNGHYKIVQLLLQKGVPPNIANHDSGTTPLIYAAENGHHDTVEALLKAGGNPNIQNKDGRSAIELASLYGYVTIVQLFLDNNADPNLPTSDGWTPLMAASQEGYTEIVELLLEKGVNPNVRNKRNGKTALIQASKNGHYETVQLLLKARCDYNIEDYEGKTAKEQAATNNHYEILELLQNFETTQGPPSTDRQPVSPPKS